MDLIHSDIPNESHLQGLTLEEIKFIRNLAKLTANAIIKSANENSLPVHKNIRRGSK